MHLLHGRVFYCFVVLTGGKHTTNRKKKDRRRCVVGMLANVWLRPVAEQRFSAPPGILFWSVTVFTCSGRPCTRFRKYKPYMWHWSRKRHTRAKRPPPRPKRETSSSSNLRHPSLLRRLGYIHTTKVSVLPKVSCAGEKRHERMKQFRSTLTSFWHIVCLL